MLHALHLLERLSSVMYLLDVCFRENFSSLTVQYLKTHMNSTLLVRENTLCSYLQEIQKQLDLFEAAKKN